MPLEPPSPESPNNAKENTPTPPKTKKSPLEKPVSPKPSLFTPTEPAQTRPEESIKPTPTQTTPIEEIKPIEPEPEIKPQQPPIKDSLQNEATELIKNSESIEEVLDSLSRRLDRAPDSKVDYIEKLIQAVEKIKKQTPVNKGPSQVKTYTYDEMPSLPDGSRVAYEKTSKIEKYFSNLMSEAGYTEDDMEDAYVPIMTYRDDGHIPINLFLRGEKRQEDLPKWVVPTINKLQSLIKNAPALGRETLLYRGIKGRINMGGDLVDASMLNKGMIIKEKGFSSTSVDVGVGAKFAAQIRESPLLRIRAPASTKGIYVDNTDVDPEYEILLQAGTEVRVTKVTIINLSNEYGTVQGPIYLVDAELIR